MEMEHAPSLALEPYLVFVDDDTDDLEVVIDTYAGMGLQNRIKVFTSGEALLDYLRTLEQPDLFPSLIVIDYNMPRINGLALLYELKKDKRLKHIPVAIYSTTLDTAKEKEMLETGALLCREKRTAPESIRQLMIEFLSFADIFHESARP